MRKKTVRILAILGAAACLYMPAAFAAKTVTEAGKTYIIDQHGERWDVTQAVSLGFVPEQFQFGIGRDAFKPLDDSAMDTSPANSPDSLRVIGISKGDSARAYAVRKLVRHEIANSEIDATPIAAAY